MLTIQQELRNNANPEKGKILQRFFKTGKGEYAEGDIFLGLTVPQTRSIARKYFSLSLSELVTLITSKYHEERQAALMILVLQYPKAGVLEKKKIFDFYLRYKEYINNWDLIDLSSERILGPYLEEKDKAILTKLARSASIWDRRIAILATFYYIKKGNPEETFILANILIHDPHDLIQKAVGWMLREIGKKSGDHIEEAFLKIHYTTMPRTMLRYAIERFPQSKRQKYLKGLII